MGSENEMVAGGKPSQPVHFMQTKDRRVAFNPPAYVTPLMVQQLMAGEPVDGGIDVPLDASRLAPAQPDAQQGEVEALREALGVAKRAILKAAQDTLWCDDTPAETVVDRIDSLTAESDGQERLPLATPSSPALDAATIERCAQAIYEEDDPWAKAWPWPNLNPEAQGGAAMADRYRSIARVCLTAALPNAEKRHG